MRQALGVASAMQGGPAAAIVSVPHNDTWPFEDNVDATHPANLRYVIAGNVQRVVSAKLTMHLAPYRTYSSFAAASTGNPSIDHHHNATASVTTGNFALTHTLRSDNTGVWALDDGSSRFVGTTNFDTNLTAGEDVAHTHLIVGSTFLGITEGAVAAGVTISFDGVDHTADLGGPFNADVIELDVLPYLSVTQNVIHTIAMLPSGLGRLEAHLRFGMYVAAGSVF